MLFSAAWIFSWSGAGHAECTLPCTLPLPCTGGAKTVQLSDRRRLAAGRRHEQKRTDWTDRQDFRKRKTQRSQTASQVPLYTVWSTFSRFFCPHSHVICTFHSLQFQARYNTMRHHAIRNCNFIACHCSSLVLFQRRFRFVYIHHFSNNLWHTFLTFLAVKRPLPCPPDPLLLICQRRP